MTNTELIDLLKELTSSPAETEWIEFKENNTRPQKIGEYISALGNSACYHKKETNQKKSQNMFPIGFKILCDGYVIIRIFSKVKTLIFNNILCDGYVMIGNQPHQADEITETNCIVLCHGYVIIGYHQFSFFRQVCVDWRRIK